MLTPSETKSFNDSMDLFDDIVSENEQAGASNQIKYQCPFCNDYNSPDEFRLQSHIRLTHIENDSQNSTSQAMSNSRGPKDEMYELLETEAFFCPYCTTSHETRDILAEHFTMIHGDELERSDMEDMMGSLGCMLCPLCKYVCSSAIEMQQHVDTQHSCRKESCKDSFGNEACARGVSSDSLKVTVCPMCGLQELDSDLLTSHIELHFESSSSSSAGKQGPSLPSTSKKTESHLSTTSKRTESHTLSSPKRIDSHPLSTIKRVESHSLSSSSSASSSKSSLSVSSSSKAQDRRKRNGNSYKNQYRQGLERDVVKGKMSPGEYYEHLAQMQDKDLNGVDDGHSRVDGLIEQLESFYRHHSRVGQSAVLCSPMDYYCGSYGDKGWGCGYRNFQMMLSCLSRIRIYSSKLFKDGTIRIPSVPKIQEMIETAWQKGFDREGCLQLEAKLSGTRKWIGATEIVATLCSMGIGCKLVDFPQPSSPDGTHPRLLQWVKDYFYKDQNAKPPLYLQHQGHSRTIVGVEVDKGTTRLLLFDPGSSKEHISSLRKNQLSWKQMSLFRRNLAAFKAKQYQIVSVVGLLNRGDYEQSKRLTSTRIL